MKNLSIIFLLAVIITFGLCIVTENVASGNSTAKTVMDSGKNHDRNSFHNLLAISENHTVMGDVSAILQKTFQETFTPPILIFISIIFLLVEFFRKKIKNNLSPPLLTSILINRREYYRKLNWSTPSIPKIFLRLNPKLYA